MFLPTPAEGAVIDGKYRLVRPLARGGMGTVWVGRHIALDEPVAIKILTISREEIEDADVRLQREAKSAARLRSPHVVQLLDYGVDRGLPYIVMELLEGEHLGKRLKRLGRLSIAGAATLLEQVARALRRVHKAGIVHRDLKPENIFLATVDDEEIVKLLDFGIIKALRGTLMSSKTHSNVLVGTPHYMSPEQTISSAELDHRSDLWSLAAILFEVLTGRKLFQGSTIFNVIMDIRIGPIPMPTEVAPDLPREIDAFFRRALQRDPEQRFPSARAMEVEFAAIARQLGPLAETTGKPLFDEQGPFVGPSSFDALEMLSEAYEPFEACMEIDAELEQRISDPPRPSLPEVDLPEVPQRRRSSVPDLAPAPASAPASVDALSDTEKVFRALTRAYPKGSIAVFIDQGFAALRNGQRELARQCWNEALARDPSNRALELNLRKLESQTAASRKE